MLRSLAALLGAAAALTARIAIAQDAPGEEAPVVPPPAPPPTAPAPPPAQTAPALEQLDLLTFHKDNYFLTGFTGEAQVKFQFSAKFDFWPNRGHHAMHFGITQKSLWALYRPSAPFVENNYNPELFYTYFHHENRYEPPAACRFFSERLGVEHESNGEDQPRSRGWNRAYIESRFACYSASKNYGIATLKVWAPPFGKTDNPDITRYLGYGDLALSVGTEASGAWYGEADVTVRARKGTSRKLGLGSLQVDARWRPRFISISRFTPFFYVQAFTGYGETLLGYDDARTNVRVGIGFSDRTTRE